MLLLLAAILWLRLAICLLGRRRIVLWGATILLLLLLLLVLWLVLRCAIARLALRRWRSRTVLLVLWLLAGRGWEGRRMLALVLIVVLALMLTLLALMALLAIRSVLALSGLWLI